MTAPTAADVARAKELLAKGGIEQCWCDVTHSDHGCAFCNTFPLVAQALADERGRAAEIVERLADEAREASSLTSGLDMRAKMNRWQHKVALLAAVRAIRAG